MTHLEAPMEIKIEYIKEEPEELEGNLVSSDGKDDIKQEPVQIFLETMPQLKTELEIKNECIKKEAEVLKDNPINTSRDVHFKQEPSQIFSMSMPQLDTQLKNKCIKDETEELLDDPLNSDEDGHIKEDPLQISSITMPQLETQLEAKEIVKHFENKCINEKLIDSPLYPDKDVHMKQDPIQEEHITENLDLYGEHEMKDDMVIGPVVLQHSCAAQTNCVRSASNKMSEQKECRPSKRDCKGKFINNDEEIEAWFQELDEENEFSDFDDLLEDEAENERSIGSHDNQEQKENEARQEDNDYDGHFQNCDEADLKYIGKNGFVWSKTEVARTSTTLAHNIIHTSRTTDPLVFRSFVDLWSKIFDSEMIATIVLHTNEKLQTYRERFRNTNRHELKDTNEIEIRSLFGLLYYSSVFKCNDADANDLFTTDGTGYEIFRCVMSKYRFCTLLTCLRFDCGSDRQERLKTDRLTAISWVFNKFVTNSQQSYIPGPNICIDEMLIPFQGRCNFIMYMPKKPAKYGIKIVVLSDALTYYTYNAYVYCGKESDGEGLSTAEKQLEVPTQSVLRLSKPIVNSNRNITADNCFSSIPLIEILKTNELTYLGPLKKNKSEIPPSFLPNKRRTPGSSLYGFTKEYTLLSYVPKQNKAIILISSSHHAESADENTKEPTMISDYNRTKGAVDEIDKKCLAYPCSRKTRRWPMAILYRILDLAGINAFVLYQSCSAAKLRRRNFLLSLARDLVLPSLKERFYNDRLPRELRLTIRRVLGKDLPSPQPVAQIPVPSVRKLCSICPSKLKRRTRYHCCACKKPICLQCSTPVCEDCTL